MTANVRSLDAIEAVQTALASFRGELELAITNIAIEMRRVLDWLEHDRPRFWRGQVRAATDAVTEARAALHRCLMYPIGDERPSCSEERAALARAQARLAYCEEKAEGLRHWIREIRHEMFEYEGRISQLVEIVEIDAPQAIAILDKLLARLHEYQSFQPHADRSRAAANMESLAIELMPERTIQQPNSATSSPVEQPRDEKQESL
jgi:hypothetical protein